MLLNPINYETFDQYTSRQRELRTGYFNPQAVKEMYYKRFYEVDDFEWLPRNADREIPMARLRRER